MAKAVLKTKPIPKWRNRLTTVIEVFDYLQALLEAGIGRGHRRYDRHVSCVVDEFDHKDAMALEHMIRAAMPDLKSVNVTDKWPNGQKRWGYSVSIHVAGKRPSFAKERT